MYFARLNPSFAWKNDRGGSVTRPGLLRSTQPVDFSASRKGCAASRCQGLPPPHGLRGRLAFKGERALSACGQGRAHTKRYTSIAVVYTSRSASTHHPASAKGALRQPNCR